jgi:hypothetical protein
MTKYKVEKLEPEAAKATYVGMNKFAAKALGFPWRHKKKSEHVIEVKPGFTDKYRKRIIHHEETEEYFMKNKHYKYKKADALAQKYEKEYKPFPRKNTKRAMEKIGFIKK